MEVTRKVTQFGPIEIHTDKKFLSILSKEAQKSQEAESKLL